MKKLDLPTSFSQQVQNFFTTQQQAGRGNFVMGFIGDNKTGKSTVSKKIAYNWKKTNPRDIIIAHDPQRNFKDIANYLIKPGDKEWAKKFYTVKGNEYSPKFTNALVILDDYKLINPQYTPVEGFEVLMYFRYDWNLDFIYSCHNPGLVIELLTSFTTHYNIFYCNSKDATFDRKLPNSDLCIAAQRIINDYVSKRGRGKYPIFPYITVDTEKQKLIANNMSQYLK